MTARLLGFDVSATFALAHQQTEIRCDRFELRHVAIECARILAETPGVSDVRCVEVQALAVGIDTYLDAPPIEERRVEIDWREDAEEATAP